MKLTLNIPKSLVLTVLLHSLTHAQFDSLIFSKYINLNYEGTSIYQLGDQNKDGFDDIMLYDCNDERGYIYFGGSPMDTIAVNTIRFFDSANNILGSIAVIDINDDSVKDIVVTTRIYNDSLFWHPGPIRIYYGGEVIDTIPNFSFNPPPGEAGVLPQVLRDFNGDGRSELVLWDPNLPFSDKQYGTLYFYNTESQFDTIPHYVMMGDSVNKIKIGPLDPGDLNGDGKSDFMIYSVVEGPPQRFYRSFYLGNESWNFTPAQTFYRDEHTFELAGWKIINDINGDGKDDILMDDYGFYPYYYRNVILHGSFPIDTIPDVGLNAQNIPLSSYSTFSLGDVNGDGYNDFFSKDAAPYPNVKLWVGGREMPYTSGDQANKTWFGTSSGFGWIIAAVGDVDGDSVNDIAIGERPYFTECDPGRVYIFKGDTSVIGDTGTVTVNEIGFMPESYYLYDPYPNPFNPSTVISYRLSVNGKIKITVYDILGKEVAILVNEEKSAGKYSISFYASNLSSGIYFCQLRTKDFVDTKKMILLK